MSFCNLFQIQHFKNINYRAVSLKGSLKGYQKLNLKSHRMENLTGNFNLLKSVAEIMESDPRSHCFPTF